MVFFIPGSNILVGFKSLEDEDVSDDDLVTTESFCIFIFGQFIFYLSITIQGIGLQKSDILVSVSLVLSKQKLRIKNSLIFLFILKKNLSKQRQICSQWPYSIM